MPTKTKRALVKDQKAPQIKGASLAAVIKAELSKPVVPGETIFGTGDVEAFKGRATKELTVSTSSIGNRRSDFDSAFQPAQRCGSSLVKKSGSRSWLWQASGWPTGSTV